MLETLDTSRDQARTARATLDEAVTRMGDSEANVRHCTLSGNSNLTRDQAREAARGVREAMHALALTLEVTAYPNGVLESDIAAHGQPARPARRTLRRTDEPTQ